MMIVMNVTGMVGGGMSGPATWLSEAPAEGTVPSDGMQPVVVTFDASKVNKPGTYKASATVNSNDPQNQALDVQTTMVVTAPANWGVLQGTISSLGHCDANPGPAGRRDGAGHRLERHDPHARRPARTAPTSSGCPTTAARTRSRRPKPTICRRRAGGIVVTGLGTTTQDLSLRWMRPCVTETPAALSATVDWQQSATLTMTLANTGAAATPFKITEMPGQFIPMGVTGNQILIVNDGGSNTNPTNAFKTAMDNLGYTYDVVSSSSSTGIPANMFNYHGGALRRRAEHRRRAEPAGGLPGWRRAAGHRRQRLRLHRQDHRPLPDLLPGDLRRRLRLRRGDPRCRHRWHGTDADISSDPYPDSFTIGPDAVGIFANTAPRVNWAGMRIARNAYKAVYFAWDYHYAGGSTVGDAIETEILGKVMPWLTAADVDWLTATPDQGTLAADTGSQAVQVALDAAAASVLQPGTYTARLKIETEDPGERQRSRSR